MKTLSVCSFLILVLGGFGEEDEHPQQESIALVKKLTAVCSKDGIKVSVRFTAPFAGIVFSHGHYDTPECVFINERSNASLNTNGKIRFSFIIPADKCGTIFHDPGSALQSHRSNITNEFGNGQDIFMENTVMFQRNHYIQEQGDLAQTLRCVWQKEIRRPLQATLPLRGIHPEKYSSESRNVSEGQRVNQNVYFASPPRRQSPLTKGFLPKGQVESVSFGRRSGKSIDFPMHYHSPSRSLQNLTALALKADESAGNGAGYCFLKHKFVLCNYAVFAMLTNTLLSKPF